LPLFGVFFLLFTLALAAVQCIVIGILAVPRPREGGLRRGIFFLALPYYTTSAQCCVSSERFFFFFVFFCSPIEVAPADKSTADILKITLSLYLSHELSDFDQIWYAGANFHSEYGYLSKIRNFPYSRWRTDAILKIVFGYISAVYWPINAKFGMEMKNHTQI